MKRIKFLTISLALLFAVMLAGCGDLDDGEKYTIWTGSQTYAVFSKQFGELNDGYYFYNDLTDSEFKQIHKSLSNDNKHLWTSSQITNWFRKHGFGDYEARENTQWLVNGNHCLLASRTGSNVYILVK